MSNHFDKPGFSEVQRHAEPKPLRLPLPLPADFFRQDVYSTPLIEAVSKVDPERRSALEEDVCGRWQAPVKDGALPVEVGMTTATARGSERRAAAPWATRLSRPRRPGARERDPA